VSGRDMQPFRHSFLSQTESASACSYPLGQNGEGSSIAAPRHVASLVEGSAIGHANIMAL
jgi:hypothetical protein